MQKYLLKLVGPLILVILLLKIDFNKLVKIFGNLKLSFIVLSAVLFLIVIPLKSYRWFHIARLQGIKIKFSKALHLYSKAIVFGLITPGRVGELIKIKYLVNVNIDKSKAAFNVILDRLLDVVVIFGLSIIGFTWIIYDLKIFNGAITGLAKHKFLIGLALFIVLSLSYVFIANKKVIILKKIKEEIRLFWGQAKTLLPVDYYWIIFITIIACFLNVVPFILFSLELNLPINVFLIVAVVLCSTLIALVPVTIAGIGTRESFIMFYFMRKHIDKEIALAFCSMFLLMYLVNIVGILLFNVASHNRD